MASLATIDDLPGEVICCEILRNLSLEEILNCKLISKGFCQIVSDFRAKRLQIGWRSNETSNSIDFCHPNLFLFQANRPILGCLQYLKIENYPTDFDLNCINRFTELKRLNIQNANELKGLIDLKLPNLLDFEFIYNGGCQLVVDAVKLKRLVYDQGSNCDGPLGSIELVHPETVSTLESCFHGDQLKPFKNVRHLRSGREFKIFETATLSNLPELVEINYTVSYTHIFDHFAGWDRIVPIMRSFMDQKRAQKRIVLRVLFGGLELTDDKAIDEYQFEKYSDNKESFYLANYEHLVGIQPVRRVNYSNLMSCLDGKNLSTCLTEIPDDYFSRFQLVDEVEVNGRVDQKHFAWFLRCLKSEIHNLDLKNSLLDQSFYDDQLPALYSSSLRSLEISEKASPILSWNFIGELKQINSLSIDLGLSLSQVRSMLNSIKDRKPFDLNFVFNSRKFSAYIEIDCFTFRQNRKLVDGVDSVEEIIEFFGNMM